MKDAYKNTEQKKVARRWCYQQFMVLACSLKFENESQTLIKFLPKSMVTCSLKLSACYTNIMNLSFNWHERKLLTEIEKVSVHLQKELAFKIVRIQSRSSWTKDKSCNAEEPFAGR